MVVGVIEARGGECTLHEPIPIGVGVGGGACF
jgi:hypothetical protein